MKTRARFLVGAVYLLIAMATARTALAAEPPVVVGEVGTRVVGGNVDQPKMLRHVLEREIATLGLWQSPRAKHFILSASIVKLERQEDPGIVSCTVSIVLRETKSGTIRAILEGRARASAQGSEGETVALEAAGRAAVGSLAEAVR